MAISQHTRQVIYAETGGKCIYCGRDLVPSEYTIDHIVPKKGCGGKNRDNLVLACPDCNNRKGAMTAREYRAMMSPKKRESYDTRVRDYYHAGYINVIKEELLMGRSVTETHQYQMHFSTLLFDIHIKLMIRRKS